MIKIENVNSASVSSVSGFYTGRTGVKTAVLSARAWTGHPGNSSTRSHGPTASLSTTAVSSSTGQTPELKPSNGRTSMDAIGRWARLAIFQRELFQYNVFFTMVLFYDAFVCRNIVIVDVYRSLFQIFLLINTDDTNPFVSRLC